MHAQEKERMCVRERVKSVTGWMEGRLRSVNHFFLCKFFINLFALRLPTIFIACSIDTNLPCSRNFLFATFCFLINLFFFYETFYFLRQKFKTFLIRA